ncbi:minor structural protein 6 [Lactococcus phage Tuc2009]|uniref:neck passage structure n=1 Tax=Lactococcus phage Tuc2009 TaxID=35241 RepID=UPI000009B65F|nr:neck passage structure [Lactococcus phage Tuc2009]AAK19880.1 minor structural protein 6 [Lactococcus phage Tuc2009]
MSLDNFKKQTITWDMINQAFEQPIQIMEGDVNARTLLLKITDNGSVLDLTGYSVKLTYQYMYKYQSGFIMLTPNDISKGEFTLIIPTEMTVSGLIKSNLILLNEDKEQVIVSKNLTFISDDSTVTSLTQEVNNKIDDFTKLLLENMPQVMRSELNDLHAQTDSNKSNIELKANLADMTSLQSAMTDLQKEVEAFGITPENLVTIKSLLDAIASNASESEVVELINSVKVLTSNISLMSNGDYSPKANQTDLDNLQDTVDKQGIAISAKANQTDLDNLQDTVDKQGIAISAKANQTDLDNLQDTVDKQGIAISAKVEQSELLSTNQNVATAQETAKQAESEAKNAMAKATKAQANSLPLNGNAVSASKLETARKLGVNLQSSAYQNFDGTADTTNIGLSGVLPIANGGTATSDGIINTIAYANSADGTDRFTTVYPNLNLLEGTKDFSGLWDWADTWTTDGTYEGLTVKKVTTQWGGIHKTFTAPKDGTYTFSAYVKSSGSNANTIRFTLINSSENPSLKRTFSNDFDWFRDSITVTLKANDQVLARYEMSGSASGSALWTAGHKWEEGSIATPYMPSASEVTINDYPKYVGFSNIIKPNKKSSDYKWLPMGLVSIDSATGSLKPAVIGIDCAQAHPVGSVVTNNSNLSSGYTTGTWQNIGSAVIGSTTIYYWQRTA